MLPRYVSLYVDSLFSDTIAVYAIDAAATIVYFEMLCHAATLRCFAIEIRHHFRHAAHYAIAAVIS